MSHSRSFQLFPKRISKRAIPALLAATLALAATASLATATTETISLSITPTQTLSNVYFIYGPDTSLNVVPVLVTSGPITGGNTYTTSLTVDTTGVGGPVQFGTIIATYPGTSSSGVSVGLDSGNASYSDATSGTFDGYFSTYSTAGATYGNGTVTEAGVYGDLTSANTYDLLSFYDGASTDASGNAAAGAAAVPIGTTGTLINFADETSNGITGGTFLASVPEPAALIMLGAGGLVILLGGKARRS
jgi:hypothetical protein